MDLEVSQRGKIRERIIRVLLNDPIGLSKYRIWKNTNASFSWVHKYLKKLEEMGFISGTKVIDFNGLLHFWVNIRKIPEKMDYLIQNPIELLNNVNLKYAVTTYKAENIVQNYLFISRFDIYIEKKEFNIWNNILMNKGLIGKGNFRLLIDDNHVFYKMFNKQNLTLVSKPQLIVDLLLEGGVAVEAANYLINSMEGTYVQ